MGGDMGPVGFDLDMTLIDSRPAILASFAALAEDTGTAIDLAAVDSRLGIKLEDELVFWYPPDQRAAAAGDLPAALRAAGRADDDRRCRARTRRWRRSGPRASAWSSSGQAPGFGASRA